MFQYFVWGERTGKAHKLLTGATENGEVTGDSFRYRPLLLLSARGGGCQPHKRKMWWFLGGDFSIFRAFSYSEIIQEEDGFDGH